MRKIADRLYARLDRSPTLLQPWQAGGYDEPVDSFEFGLQRVLDGTGSLIQRRYETRDVMCPSCGAPTQRSDAGRPRTYCSPACRQRAYRRRTSH
ncbi:hypothetical protein JQS43_22405 [Natronosporangium hydrolyticum]|uniref:Uncharacterized protein n=1 Tax=Natronosporangium hydrolyticum TaxID=2811111 RepID=A0A895Y907_9ACTN|nr:hypothetical protein [Natronosporangium hydrolyticum]QSB14234.1 hypothetical protein JQS43_22405 [Natronosporangium hydrolyticum]